MDLDPEKVGWPLPVDRIQVYELLERRMFPMRNSVIKEEREKQAIPLEELFLILPAQKNRNGAYEQFSAKFTLLPDTRFTLLYKVLPGELLVFFIKPQKQSVYGPLDIKPAVCWNRVFKYPNV